MKDRSRKGGKKDVSSPCSHLVFFPTPTSTCSTAPPAAEILKGLPLNCQSVLFSYKRSFCHLHSFYCLARQLTAQPRSSLLFPEPRAGAQTVGEQPQQRKVTPLCRWRPRFISNINLHEHCGRPKRRDVCLACWHWNLAVSWVKFGHRLEPGTNIPILLEWFKNCVEPWKACGVVQNCDFTLPKLMTQVLSAHNNSYELAHSCKLFWPCF